MKACLHCGKSTKNPKYCSRSCAASDTNKIPKRKLTRTCRHCSSIVRNWRSTLCEKHFQDALLRKKVYIEQLTMADFINRNSIKGLPASSKRVHIRNLCRSWNKELTKLPCAYCGYSKHVELAHIIPVSSFPSMTLIKDINSRENIIQLCPNCHWEFDNGYISLDEIRKAHCLVH